MNRRSFLRNTLVATSLSPLADACGVAASPAFDANTHLIRSPEDSAQWSAFRQALAQWREAKRTALNYSDALYRNPEFAWVRSSFCCCFLMLCDETFYDTKSGTYKVHEFVEHGRREFGGYDSIVLWHAYPRIGLDARNQFDFYRDMPGGLAGVRNVVEELHREGLKVYIDYNPWDRNTRRESKDDLDLLAEIVGALEVDGIFLDTMDRGAEAFRAKLDAVRSGVILESEGALPLERVHDHHMSWAQGFGDSRVPGILRNKWFERRHMQHQIDRWRRDHTVELHQAWMNGSGIMVWENVFGTWVGWNHRDRSILRSMLPIQRRYAELFSGESWTPLVPTLHADVYASLWSNNTVRLWTLVNRSEMALSGDLLGIPHGGNLEVMDLIKGEKARIEQQGDQTIIRGKISPRGVGCFMAGET